MVNDRSTEAMISRMNAIMDLLTSRGMTVAQISEEMDISQSAVRRLIELMRDDIRIESHKKSTKGHAAVYRAGAGPDAPLPDGWVSMGRNGGAPKVKAKVESPGRDPLVAALFGAAA